MSKADISQLKDKYSNFGIKQQPTPKKKGTVSGARKNFNLKLEDEKFSEFNSTDWIMYFSNKYQEATEHEYIIIGKTSWFKEHAIYKSLIKEMAPQDIKLMIDFLFDSEQDIKPKAQSGSYLLSQAWLQSVYSSAKLWQRGEYKSTAQIQRDRYKSAVPEKRNREWTREPKDIKPTNATPILPKRKKKTKITF